MLPDISVEMLALRIPYEDGRRCNTVVIRMDGMIGRIKAEALMCRQEERVRGGGTQQELPCEHQTVEKVTDGRVLACILVMVLIDHIDKLARAGMFRNGEPLKLFFCKAGEIRREQG